MEEANQVSEESKELVITDAEDVLTLEEQEEKNKIEEMLKSQGYGDIKVVKKQHTIEDNLPMYFYENILKRNLEECELTLESLGKRKKLLEYEVSIVGKVKGNNRNIYTKLNRDLMPIKDNIENYKKFQSFYKKLKKVLDEEYK